MEKITFTKNGIKLDINFSKEENTIWMSQKDLAILYSKDRTLITKLINKILNGNEEKVPTCAKFAPVETNGKNREIKVYNLDIIKQIGYKINPFFTDSFVAWVKEELNKINNQIIPIQSNIIRFNNGTVSLDVTIEPMEDTVYLDKERLIILFDTTRQNIEYHIANIFESGELEFTPTCKEILQVQKEGDREITRPVTLYNLDLIISLGFRINNKRGIEFRRWANKILKSYLYKGYTIDENRMKIIESNYVYLKGEIDNIKNIIEKHELLISSNDEKQVVFFKGQFFDTYDFFCNLINKANKCVIIVDPYIDETVLSLLKNKKKNVRATVITTNKCSINNHDLETFEKQYGPIEIIRTNPFHSRNILLDDEEVYLIEASFNRMGHYRSSVIQYDTVESIRLIKNDIYKMMK